MNTIKRNIPNIITLANLFCGLLAIIFAFQNNLTLASFCIFTGAFFDVLDGLTARLLKVNSNLGKQLDSMADMVTFGVAPGFILFHLMGCSAENITFNISNIKDFFPVILALLTPIFSAIRLAKFNIDSKQTTSFVGLPTPMLAIFIAAIPLINNDLFSFFMDIRFLISLSIILPLLLVSKIQFFSLKKGDGNDRNSRLNIFRITLILVSALLLLAIKFAAIPFIVILYLILSIANNIIK